MEIKITENQVNYLVCSSGTGEFIAEQLGGHYDRFYLMTSLIDKISIFTDLEWKNIYRDDYEGEVLRRGKLKKYVEKNFPAEECYYLTFSDELHMILALNLYKNKSGCLPFLDYNWDKSYPMFEQQVYFLLIHKKDYLEK